MGTTASLKVVELVVYFRLTWLSSVTSRWRSASAYVTDIALDALSKT